MTHSQGDPGVLLTLCTCPDDDSARQLGRQLVREQLAACVSILPGVTSVFVWEGAVQSEPEVLMVIKTTSRKYPQLEAALRELHPYEVPEIIAAPITHGLTAYLDWVVATVGDTGT